MTAKARALIAIYYFFLTTAWFMVVGATYWIASLYVNVPFAAQLRALYEVRDPVGSGHGPHLSPVPSGGKNGLDFIPPMLGLGSIMLWALRRGRREAK